jgi:creatinine amidohydrolase/Fe(II)-dependent formamide hydrolase-like protein
MIRGSHTVVASVIAGELARAYGLHAGELETSILLHAAPDLVREASRPPTTWLTAAGT